MKESRVSKYQKYRESILKEDLEAEKEAIKEEEEKGIEREMSERN